MEFLVPDSRSLPEAIKRATQLAHILWSKFPEALWLFHIDLFFKFSINECMGDVNGAKVVRVLSMVTTPLSNHPTWYYFTFIWLLFTFLSLRMCRCDPSFYIWYVDYVIDISSPRVQLESFHWLPLDSRQVQLFYISSIYFDWLPLDSRQGPIGLSVILALENHLQIWQVMSPAL